jgi:hypothetical protein
VMSNAVTRLTPLMVRERVTVTELMARVATLSAVGGGNDVFRVGIYASDPVTLKATTCLGSVGGLATTATGAISGALGASFVLEPGLLYWGAVQVANSTAAFQAVRADHSPVSAILGDPVAGTASSATALALNCVTVTTVGYAAGMTDLTAVTQTAISNSGNALVWWKAAA